MASKVQFKDNSAQVKAALNDGVIAYLYEAGGELETQTKRNSTQGRKYGNIQATNLWKYNVDESKKETKVGSPYEAGYWEELGRNPVPS